MRCTSANPRSSQYASIIHTATMESPSYYPDTRDRPVFYNQNYKDDLRVSVQLIQWTLTSIGIWPKSMDHSWLETLRCRVLNVICYTIMAMILIPCSMYIVLEIKDFYNQLKLGSALTFFMMAVIKYCALIIRESDIRRCVEYIEGDWKNVRYAEDREIMLENANFGRRLVVICSAFMYGSVLFYYVAVPLTRAKIVDESGNLTYRQLVFPVPKIIVDTRRSPVNEFFILIHVICGIVTHIITVSACGLVALLAMHACGQLQVLMSWIDHLVDGRKDVTDTVDERLANIVRLHVRILK